jgi:hypothetical protein
MYSLGVNVGVCELSSDAEGMGDVEKLFVGQWTRLTLCTVQYRTVNKAVTP